MPLSWDRLFDFPSEGRHAEDFYIRKIRRLRPDLNPRTREPEASMLTSRTPKPLKNLFVAYNVRMFQYPVHKSNVLVTMPSQKMAVHNINIKKRVGEMHIWSGETRNKREFLCSLVCLQFRHLFGLKSHCSVRRSILDATSLPYIHFLAFILT
jgi:hypothetical protein